MSYSAVNKKDSLTKKAPVAVASNISTLQTSQIDSDFSFFSQSNICSCDGGCPVCTDSIQPKLIIGSPNDRYEQEADRVADQIMRMPEPAVQRAPT